jgi:ribonuclease D
MAQPPPLVEPTIVRGDITEAQLATYLESREVGVDTETMGLNTLRDRLCLVQLCDRERHATIVQIPRETLSAPMGARAPRLKKLMEDRNTLKIFHFARFDVAALRHYLGIEVDPLYCTRTASKLVRTYTDRHGLKDIALELLDVQLDKAARHTDWSADELAAEQVQYAISDVTLLHQLMDRLEKMIEREGRRDLAQACFRVIPTLSRLDLMGYEDIFIH